MLWLPVVLVSFLPLQAGVQRADSLASRPFTFAVVGHIRGDAQGNLNPKLNELIERLRAARPDFVLLTGDIIWGEVDHVPRDTAVVRRQWEAVDSALAPLAVPLFRVPGNHDISDLLTRDLYYQRYGPVPQSIERHGSGLLLLGSAWIPADGDTSHRTVTRPAALDSGQTAWLRSELARQGDWDHTFVALHHMLWWDSTAAWWRDIHPLLAPAGVRLVFAGDYGPLKFSNLTRDGVRYVQSSMEGIMKVETLRAFERSRILSAQFDNFLLVRVTGDSVEVEVKTLGEWSSPQYQPQFYQAMMPPPQSYGWRRRLEVLSNPRVIAGLVGFGLAALAIGFVVGKSRKSTQ